MTAEKNRKSAYMKMLKNYPDVLNVEQMCEVLGGISTKTGYKILKGNQIKSVRVGRAYLITKIDVIDFLINTTE